MKKVHPLPKDAYAGEPGYADALGVLLPLRRAGFESYFAGGCVRDALLGVRSKDFDVATAARPEEVTRLFPRTIPLGLRFGTVGVVQGNSTIQVTSFRSEGPYLDGRHPEFVAPASPLEDASRRDFTINGLFADPERGEVLDFVGGVQDLGRKVLRAIGDPTERFREDALRLLRAARFAVRLGFSIDDATQQAIRAQAQALRAISAERVRDELQRMLVESDPAASIRTLDTLGLLAIVLPEIDAMKGIAQPPEFHPEGDVFVHTLLVLEKIESRDPVLLWAALLHDVAKPATYSVSDRIRFHGHDKLGVEMAEKILKRLAFSNAEIDAVKALIEDHLFIAGLPKMREGKRRRFLRRPDLERHLALHRADCLASHGKLDIYEFCRREMSRLGQEDLHPAPLLRGNDLLAMGIAPGPKMGKILAALEDEQLEGRVLTREFAELWVRSTFLSEKS